MANRFANQTTVSVEKSRSEIEGLLRRAGATQFVSGWNENDQAAIQFVIRNRSIRFVLPLPRRDDKAFAYTPARRKLRSFDERTAAWEQACRSRWRALLLVIKAKLEAIECGISTLEHEFLAWMVTASGQTIGERLLPNLDDALVRDPKFLIGGGA